MEDTHFSEDLLPRGREEEYFRLRYGDEDLGYKTVKVWRTMMYDMQNYIPGQEFHSGLTEEQRQEMKRLIQDRSVNSILEDHDLERYNRMKIIYGLEDIENFKISPSSNLPVDYRRGSERFCFKTKSAEREQHSSTAGSGASSDGIVGWSASLPPLPSIRSIVESLRGLSAYFYSNTTSQEEGDTAGAPPTEGEGEGAASET